MKIVDSSFLISLTNPSDSNHKAAIKLHEKHYANGYLYLDDVLKETQTILNLKIGTAQMFRFVDELYREEKPNELQYLISPQEHMEILNFWRNLSANKFSFVDLEILFLANKYKYGVLSFDLELLSFLPS
jgi:predicted nucleic acid-binding protein